MPGAAGQADPDPELLNALQFIDPACDYDDWLHVGMALHHETGGSEQGFHAFHEWSRKAEGQVTPSGNGAYQGEDHCRRKWASFSDQQDTPVTCRTVFQMARECGYHARNTADQGESVTATTRLTKEQRASNAAERAEMRGLIPYATAEAYRRAVAQVQRATVADDALTPEAAAAALGDIDEADEDVVVDILEGDESTLRKAFRTGGGDTTSLLAPVATGAGTLLHIDGISIPVTWAVSDKASAKTGTLRTPRFTDRLTLDNASRRSGAAKKLAKAHGFVLTPDHEEAIDQMLMVFTDLDVDSRAEIESGGDRDADADRVVALVEERALELFRTPGGLDADCYATVPVSQHHQVWPIDSRGFKRWASYQYRCRYGKVVGETAMQNAVSALSGKALFDGLEHDIFVRRGFVENRLYLDLADGTGRAIEIDADGWRVVDPIACGVHFLRRSGMLPLPMPVLGGKVDELRSVLNAPDDLSWVLVKGFILSCLHPTGPYLGLAPNGEQGSGKSQFSRTIRRTLDPSDRDLRRPITNEPDLAIAATSSLIVAVDNLSRLSENLSDAYCSLATGASLSKRRLYTDFDEVSVHFKRPVILNGINNVATRADLADRVLPLYLPAIPKRKRRSEAQLEAAFVEMHPRVLGALLTAASAALRRGHEVVIEDAERMVDILKWVVAAEPELGIETGGFQRAYAEKVTSAAREALENSPVAIAIVEAVEAWRAAGKSEWAGTCKDLLGELDAGWGDQKPPKGWPGSPQGLHHALRRAAPLLRREGIEVVEPEKDDRPRIYRLLFPPDAGPEDSDAHPSAPPAGRPTFSDDAGHHETSGADCPGGPQKGGFDDPDISDVSWGLLRSPGPVQVGSSAAGSRVAMEASREGACDQSVSPAALANSRSATPKAADPTRSATVDADALALRQGVGPGVPLQSGKSPPENVGNVGNVESAPGYPKTGRCEPTFLVDQSSAERRNNDGSAADTDEARGRREMELAIERDDEVAVGFASMSLARLVGRGPAREIEAEIRAAVRGRRS